MVSLVERDKKDEEGSVVPVLTFNSSGFEGFEGFEDFEGRDEDLNVLDQASLTCSERMMWKIRMKTP